MSYRSNGGILRKIIMLAPIGALYAIVFISFIFLAKHQCYISHSGSLV